MFTDANNPHLEADETAESSQQHRASNPASDEHSTDSLRVAGIQDPLASTASAVAEVAPEGGTGKEPVVEVISIPEGIEDDDLLGAVDAYKNAGFVPIPLIGKKPRVRNYTEFSAKKLIHSFIQKYWGGEEPSNIGLLMKRPLAGIDLDAKKDRGASAETWLKEHPELAHVPRERSQNGFHLIVQCNDMPLFFGGTGKPYKGSLMAQLNASLSAELKHSGLPVTVAPSVHESGTTYRWEVTGPVPNFSWAELCSIFGFREPDVDAERTKGRLGKLQWLQESFEGDLRSLDVVAFCKEVGIYGRPVDADQGKHSVKCPFCQQHSDGGSDWRPDDTATVVFEGDEDRAPAFVCKHAHCSEKGLGEFVEFFVKDHKQKIEAHCRRHRRKRIVLPGKGRSQSRFAREVGEELSKKQIYLNLNDVVVKVGEVTLEGQARFALAPLVNKEAITALEDVIDFGVYGGDDKGWLEHSMSEQTVGILLKSPKLLERLPRIERALHVPIPVFRKGEIQIPKPGFDKELGTYLAPNAPQIPDMGLDEAVDVIEDLLGGPTTGGFAFKDQQAKTNAITWVLLPFCRGLMEWKKTPVFMFLANQARVGKDKLASIAFVLYTGAEFVDAPLTKGDDSEMRKRITSHLLAGEPFIHFANMKGRIDFPSLEAATDSSTSWRDRLLTLNKNVTLRNEAQYSFSANLGAGWTPDIAGRSVIVQLFYPGEDPESRTFKHSDILRHVLANRLKILGACKALVVNWDNNGRPTGPTPKASFPIFAEIAAGIVWSAGLGDPCVREKDEHGILGDPEVDEMKILFQRGHEKFGNDYRKKDDVYDLVRGMEYRSDPIFSFLDFNKSGDCTSFGRKLAKYAGRTLDGITLQVDSSDKSRRRYAFIKDDFQPVADVRTLRTLRTSPCSLEVENRNCDGGGGGEIRNENRNDAGNVRNVRNVRKTYPSFTPISSADDVDDIIETLQSDPRSPIGLIIQAGSHSPAVYEYPPPQVNSISLSLRTGETYIVQVPKVSSKLAELLEALKTHKIVGHNLGNALATLRYHFNFEPRRLFCTRTASKILHNGLQLKHDLHSCLERELGVTGKWAGTRLDWEDEISNEHLEYLAFCAQHQLELAQALWEKLKAAKLTKTTWLDMNIIPITVGMHLNGVEITRSKLELLLKQVRLETATLRGRMKEVCGQDFNPGSHKQVLEKLHELGISAQNTKIDELKQYDHPFARDLVEYAKLKVVKDKLEELKRFCSTEDDRVHPTYDPMKVTGRFSTTKPNIQGMMKSHPGLLSCLVAGKGKCLVFGDYCQQEVRVFADVAKDETIMDAVAAGIDPLKMRAADLLNIAVENVTGEQRVVGKLITYARFYGSGAAGIQRKLKSKFGIDLSLEQVEALIERDLQTRPAAKEYERRAKQDVEVITDIRTRMGRRRILTDDPGLPQDETYYIKVLKQVLWDIRFGFPEEFEGQGDLARKEIREVMRLNHERIRRILNFPIQGGAADGTKLAMIRIHRDLPKGAVLALNKHDELGVECDPELVDQVIEIMRKHMTGAMRHLYPAIPFEVKFQVVTSWDQRK